jgi:hypothetical protein
MWKQQKDNKNMKGYLPMFRGRRSHNIGKEYFVFSSPIAVFLSMICEATPSMKIESDD